MHLVAFCYQLLRTLQHNLNGSAQLRTDRDSYAVLHRIIVLPVR